MEQRNDDEPRMRCDGLDRDLGAEIQDAHKMGVEVRPGIIGDIQRPSGGKSEPAGAILEWDASVAFPGVFVAW